VCLVDIPVGLPSSERSVRRCDGAARGELRLRRATSVFSPPCEAALEARDFPEALRINRRETGRGISLQAWHLLPKIREAAAWRGRALLRESHPEVCFARLSGEPARHPKRRREGREERLRFLESVDSSVRSSLVASRAAIGPSRAAIDDFLDAAILAMTATKPLETLPPDPGTCEPVLWVPRREGG
jgi:predicted RNase H-like nuclease